jgi:hypothetical protein
MKEEDAQFDKKRILIELINRETDQFAIEQKRHGWTTWALLGALATLIWVFIDQAPFALVNWQVVGLLFFSLALTIDLTATYCSIISTQHRHLPEEPRFVLTSLIGAARISLLVRLIIYFTLFLVSINLRVHVIGIAKILVLLSLGLYILTGLIGLIVSYRQIPISKSQIRRRAGLVSLLAAAPMTIALIGYYVALIKNFSSFGQTDLKVAVILTLVGCVVVLMADLPISSPILPSLISIRRDLALDKIDIDWAARQIDIALSGMRVGDILQENIKEILDYYATIHSTLIKLTRTSEAIEKLIPAELSDLQKDEFASNWEAIEALARVFKSNADYLDSVQGELIISVDKFHMKAKQIMTIDKRSIEEIEEVIGLIKAAHEESDRVNGAEKGQIASLNARLDAVQASFNIRRTS